MAILVTGGRGLQFQILPARTFWSSTTFAAKANPNFSTLQPGRAIQCLK